MPYKIFAQAIRERLERMEPILSRIEQEGSEADLHNLRLLLIEVISLLERDPGIEAAVDDLYAAAAALVRDSYVASQPLARKLRLLRDARQRFCARLMGIAKRAGSEDQMRLQVFSSVLAA